MMLLELGRVILSSARSREQTKTSSCFQKKKKGALPSLYRPFFNKQQNLMRIQVRPIQKKRRLRILPKVDISDVNTKKNHCPQISQIPERQGNTKDRQRKELALKDLNKKRVNKKTFFQERFPSQQIHSCHRWSRNGQLAHVFCTSVRFKTTSQHLNFLFPQSPPVRYHQAIRQV